MRYSISAFPSIDPRDYMRQGKIRSPILSDKDFFLYASGRAALYYAMKTAGLPEGSCVLLPSYHCGVEVEAVIRAGVAVEFFNIKRDLGIDFDDLARRVNKKTRALVVIHYFGFPQDMDKVLAFCQTNQLLLIEDCAHALFSSYKGNFLGSLGEFGIYSLQKTIALPNGGGLLCNSLAFDAPSPGRKYFDFTLLKSTLKSLLDFQARGSRLMGKLSSGFLSIYSERLNGVKGNTTASEPVDMRWYYDVPRYDYHHAISGLSRPLLNKEKFSDIVKKRRQNYLLLGQRIRDSVNSRIIFKELDEGVCPLCFVVSVENRDRMVDEMNREKLYPFVFGRIPHPLLAINNYPDTLYLAGHLLGLPIHQQLDERDVMLVADIFENSKRKVCG